MSQNNPTMADQVKQLLANMPPIMQVNTYAVGPITIMEQVEVPKTLDLISSIIGETDRPRKYTAHLPINLQVVTDRGLANQVHTITFEIPPEATTVHQAAQWALTHAQEKASDEIKRLRMSAMAQGLGG